MMPSHSCPGGQEWTPSSAAQPSLGSRGSNGGLYPDLYRPRVLQRLMNTPVGDVLAAAGGERTYRRAIRASLGHPLTDPELHQLWLPPPPVTGYTFSAISCATSTNGRRTRAGGQQRSSPTPGRCCSSEVPWTKTVADILAVIAGQMRFLAARQPIPQPPIPDPAQRRSIQVDKPLSST